MTDFRVEHELLLCCARTAINVKTAEQIQRLLLQGVDWPYLFRMVDQHRVVPIVYQTLSRMSAGTVPKEILDRLQRQYIDNSMQGLLLTAQLIKLVEWLRIHQIYAIPYKGPTLAVAAYGNVSLRQFGDIDILVHQRDYLKWGMHLTKLTATCCAPLASDRGRF